MRRKHLALALLTILVAVLLTFAFLPLAYAPAATPSEPLAPHLYATLAAPTPYPPLGAPLEVPSEAPESPVAHETPQPAQTTRQPSTGALTEADVRSLLEAACANQGVDPSWIVGVGLKVAWGESRFRPDARNGQYVGLFQFGSGWGTEAERLSAEWSCDMFVWAYAQGGEANIRKHWKATI